MSATNIHSNPRALFIYTNVEDNTFSEEHFNEHKDLLGRAYKVEAIRTGTLSSDQVSALTKGKRYDLIEIAAHGNVSTIDLGDEELSSDNMQVLKRLVDLLNEHAVLVLQTCRSGAKVKGVPSIAVQLAFNSQRTIRVIANKGKQFQYEFRQLNPLDVRLFNDGQDLTAWIQRRPDGRVVRVDTKIIDRLQKKLVDPVDLQLAYRIAAGFGEQDLIKRFREVAAKVTSEDFKDTPWGPLIEKATRNPRDHLLKFALMDRYGALIQHLDSQVRNEAIIALFGSSADISHDLETFPEYILCCLEIEGIEALNFKSANLDNFLNIYRIRYESILTSLLEKMTIDPSFVVGTEWETMLERLSGYAGRFGGESLIEITPDQKSGKIIQSKNETSFGLKSLTAYERIGKNILALAAVERYQAILIYLDNGLDTLNNPAAIAYSKLTGKIVHSKELSFSRQLRGDESVLNLVKVLFKNLEPGSREEYTFFNTVLNAVCLNQVSAEVLYYLENQRQLSVIGSRKSFLNQMAKEFQEGILEKNQLLEVPTKFADEGFSVYYRAATVEKFIDYVRVRIQQFQCPLTLKNSSIARFACGLGFMRKFETARYLKKEELKDYLQKSNIPQYKAILQSIPVVGRVKVNHRVDLNPGRYYPLHIAARFNDQKLITLLLDLGAYVDMPDNRGHPPRKYAPDCQFSPSPGFPLKSLLAKKRVWPSFKSVKRYRHAVGGYEGALAITGRKVNIIDIAWSAMGGASASLTIAAFQVRSVVKLDLSTLLSLNSQKLNKSMDRVLRETYNFIKTLGQTIDEHYENTGNYLQFTESLKEYPDLNESWKRLLSNRFLIHDE